MSGGRVTLGASEELRESMGIPPLPADDEAIDHPKHYTSHPAKCECGRGIECIQIVEHMGFSLGCATKYIWRAGRKSPDAVTDLKKAIWYLEREVERLSKGGA